LHNAHIISVTAQIPATRQRGHTRHFGRPSFLRSLQMMTADVTGRRTQPLYKGQHGPSSRQTAEVEVHIVRTTRDPSRRNITSHTHMPTLQIGSGLAARRKKTLQARSSMRILNPIAAPSLCLRQTRGQTIRGGREEPVRTCANDGPATSGKIFEDSAKPEPPFLAR